jgi:hypothetical protein
MASKTGELCSFTSHFKFYERASYLPEYIGLEGLT